MIYSSHNHLRLGYPLTISSEVLLLSHDIPNAYPSNAYVLWTFLYFPVAENADIVYEITFAYLRINTNDYLRIGYGLDPNNTTNLISSYAGSYYGYPRDVFAIADNIFVEFDANPPGESSGFELNIAVQNISGRSISSKVIIISIIAFYCVFFMYLL